MAAVDVLVDLLHVLALFEIAFEGHVERFVMELLNLRGACYPLLGGLEVMCQ